MNYGTNSAASANDTVKFLGMEDFYGNLCQWVDGCYFAAGVSLIGDGNFNDTGAGYDSYPRNTETFNYPQPYKDVEGGNISGFIPKKPGGSQTTFYPDYGYVYTGYVPCFGGYRGSGANAGAYYFSCYSASLASSYIGARLVFCG